jgi:hypothetical protein
MNKGCVLICQLQGMPRPMVRDVQTQRDLFVSFISMRISIP